MMPSMSGAPKNERAQSALRIGSASGGTGSENSAVRSRSRHTASASTDSDNHRINAEAVAVFNILLRKRLQKLRLAAP